MDRASLPTASLIGRARRVLSATKDLKTTSKMAAETAPKMTCLLVLSNKTQAWVSSYGALGIDELGSRLGHHERSEDGFEDGCRDGIVLLPFEHFFVSLHCFVRYFMARRAFFLEYLRKYFFI